MKLVAEYLEEAIKFRRMANEAADPKLKKSLEDQAKAYQALADKRAAELKLPPINLPAVLPENPPSPSASASRRPSCRHVAARPQ